MIGCEAMREGARQAGFAAQASAMMRDCARLCAIILGPGVAKSAPRKIGNLKLFSALAMRQGRSARKCCAQGAPGAHRRRRGMSTARTAKRDHQKYHSPALPRASVMIST